MRTIYIVNATQVVISESHPEGLYSVMPNYPMNFDSRNYNNNEEKAFRMAKGEYLSRLSAIITADNPARAMATVTLERSDGRQIMHESIGTFPAEPEPEPEPEPEISE